MISLLSSSTASRTTKAQPVADTYTSSYSTELSRVLTAAVVSRKFCQLLLSDPHRALCSGYNGESFQLSDQEQALVLSISAVSLNDFAKQLVSKAADASGDYGMLARDFAPEQGRRFASTYA